MKQLIRPGKYIVAVSGGVDSVALLNMLSKHSDVELIVAHYDHDIRADSSEDRKFVQQLAKIYGLHFEYAEGHLGSLASEDLAREKRYEFLFSMKEKHDAKAIITAHHQDDVLETIVINLLRGTGRKGMSSLKSTPAIKRPLLGYTKQFLLEYATEHHLIWQEDPTNTNEAYLRNWVRRNIIPKLDETQRAELLAKRDLAAKNNQTIDLMLDSYLDSSDPHTLRRSDVTVLPHAVAVELVAHWLRTNDLEIDKKLLERVTIGAKTLLPGKIIPLKGGASIKMTAKKLLFTKQ